MTHSSLLRTSLAVPFVLTMAHGAAADVTTAQVWGDWKSYMQDIGFTVTATETVQGDDIAVSDLTITMPDTQGSVTITTGPLTFEQAGGDVNILMPDSMPVVLGSDASIEPWQMSFSLDQTGNSLTVSGDETMLTYTQAAETLGLTLTELMTDGQTYGSDNARITFTASDMQNTTNMTTGDLRKYTQQGGIAALTYDIFLDNPEEEVVVSLSGASSDLVFETTSDIPSGLETGALLPEMLAAGFGVVGTYTYGPGNLSVRVEQPVDGTFAATSRSNGGNLSVDMGGQSIGYGVVQNDLAMQVTSPDLPFPVDFSLSQAGFDLKMPVAPGEEPQDFSFGFNLSEFVMADLLWSLFDPTGQLPRDPATLDVGVSGTAKVVADLLDTSPEAAGDAPFEPRTLTIDKLLFDAVGAKLEGSGDVTFDSDDLVSYGGVPKPVGTVDLALAGGNALLDKLVTMGILPQQQAAGARLMMGLFTVPGDAPDTLKSQIVFNEQGQVLANGQRIK